MGDGVVAFSLEVTDFVSVDGWSTQLRRKFCIYSRRAGQWQFRHLFTPRLKPSCVENYPVSYGPFCSLAVNPSSVEISSAVSLVASLDFAMSWILIRDIKYRAVLPVSEQPAPLTMKLAACEFARINTMRDENDGTHFKKMKEYSKLTFIIFHVVVDPILASKSEIRFKLNIRNDGGHNTPAHDWW